MFSKGETWKNLQSNLFKRNPNDRKYNCSTPASQADRAASPSSPSVKVLEFWDAKHPSNSHQHKVGPYQLLMGL